MSMFTLTVSCLTTSSLARFAVRTSQLPVQYCSYSLLHPTRSLLTCNLCIPSSPWCGHGHMRAFVRTVSLLCESPPGMRSGRARRFVVFPHHVHAHGLFLRSAVLFARLRVLAVGTVPPVSMFHTTTHSELRVLLGRSEPRGRCDGCGHDLCITCKSEREGCRAVCQETPTLLTLN